MIYPQFCCVTCQKSTSVKLILSLQRFLRALSLSLSRPCGALRAISAPTEERSVPVAPRRTVCNRTPHCRAAPQCASALGVGWRWRGRTKSNGAKKKTKTKLCFN